MVKRREGNIMVVIIRGPCSVGKTTAPYALAKLLPDSAYLHGDGFPWMSDRTMQALDRRSREKGDNFRNAWLATGIAVILGHGLHAVVDGMFMQDEELSDLLARLGPVKDSVRIFNLAVDPEEHLKRDAGRPPEQRIGKEGVEYFRTANEWARSNFGVKTDATRSTPKDITIKILDQIQTAD